jgi:hypothetical protein
MYNETDYSTAIVKELFSKALDFFSGCAVDKVVHNYFIDSGSM